MRLAPLALLSAASLTAAQNGPVLILNACSAAAAKVQQFTLSPNGTKLYLTATAGQQPPMCLDIEGFSTKPGATVYTWPCGSGGAGTNEDWLVGASSIASRQSPPTCLAVAAASAGEVANGTIVSTAECSASDPMQALTYSAATGLIVHTPSGLCVDAGSNLPAPAFCTSRDHASWTLCDPTASLDDRAADIVSRLSLADKILALNTATPFLASVDMPAYQWWSEVRVGGVGGWGVGGGGGGGGW